MIQRDNIGIFGKVNSGKSSLMNLLTQQECSIVDSKPGTTADTKLMLCEIHGLGAVKLFDTAGIDECGELGEKKRKKAFNDLKECDLILLVIDPSSNNFENEKIILSRCLELGKQILVIYNLFDENDGNKVDNIEKTIGLENIAPNSSSRAQTIKKIKIKAVDKSYRQPLLNFILNNSEFKDKRMELLPFVERDEYYILNIPMDEETPPGRYLRPQQMVEEFITRNWAHPVSYRMDLSKARSNNPEEAESERKRFMDFLNNSKKKPKMVITDSQAIDVMAKLAPSDILLTTFSIVMINHAAKGRLKLFVDGVKALKTVKEGDKILIAEACNHSRIAEDIGTMQIPKLIADRYPGTVVEHSFGREFKDEKELSSYKLIIHCGGCMIDSQKLNARLWDLERVGVPVTNYGVFLSYIQGEEVLRRVLEPWNP